MDSKFEVKVKKPETDMVTKDNTLSFFKSLDKNTIVLLVLVCLSLGTSFYIFKDLRKTKEQLNKLNNDALVDDILEKVDANTQNVHTIELKLDQLIKTMGQKTQQQQVQDQQIKQLMKLQKQANGQVQTQTQPQSQTQPIFMGGKIEEDNEDNEEIHEIKIK